MTSMSKLKMPANCIDVTMKHGTTTFAIIGVGAKDANFASFARRPNWPPSKRVAYHEAGHAVCGRILGFACGGASITNDGSGSAKVAGALSLCWDLTRGQDIQSSALDKITVCWSGPVAEEIKFGSADDVRGDLAQIKQLAARYFVQDHDVERARARAHELVTKHWNDVECVATALLEKKTLWGAEIDALLKSSP